MPFEPAKLQGLVACLSGPPLRCCVPLPGGAQLCDTGLKFDPLEAMAPYMAQLNAALAPLMPIMRMVAMLKALLDCVKAIPESIPVPTPLIECIPALARAALEVLKLIPAISLPFTLLAILDCVIRMLMALKLTLINMQSLRLGIQAIVPVDANQAFLKQCALQNIDNKLLMLNSLLASLSLIFGTIALLLSLIGVSGVPSEISVGADLTEAIEVIDTVLQPLVTVRAAIPIG